MRLAFIIIGHNLSHTISRNHSILQIVNSYLSFLYRLIFFFFNLKGCVLKFYHYCIEYLNDMNMGRMGQAGIAQKGLMVSDECH